MSAPMTDEQFADAITKVWLGARLAGKSDDEAEEMVLTMARFVAPERLLNSDGTLRLSLREQSQ